jgi:hypothetical protein
MDDPKVVSALEAYLAELEAGRQPSRDELLDGNPEIAGTLAGCLEILELVHSAAGAASSDGPLPQLKDARTRRAIAALRRAVLAGHADLKQVRRDPVLDPLRTRRDFRELLMDLSFPAEPFAR